MGSPSQTDYREYILEEEIEEFIKGIQSGVEREQKSKKSRKK
jgi:hypothetical protein